MAAPHVAGAAAVLKERHPTWTVEQIKSALETTGDPVHPSGSSGEVTALREGGGRIDLVRADNPLVFTNPTGLSFGLVKRGTNGSRTLTLSDAGGGASPWNVSVAQQLPLNGVTISPAAPVATAGSSLAITLTVAAGAAEGDAVGFVQLTRGTDVRRIPYWAHVEVPKLGLDPHVTINHDGVYGADTKGGHSTVSSYRYPEAQSGVPNNLSGPERVFRVNVKGKIANLGAVVLSHANGVRVSPRLVVAGDENRLTGDTSLPINGNPYANYGELEPVVGAIAPAPGAYDVVFDTPAGTTPGRFTFRVWRNDVTPPAARVLTKVVQRGHPIRVAIVDRGSGVDPTSIGVNVDTSHPAHTFKRGVLSVSSAGLKRGVHSLAVIASDYQEAKNMENVGPILPNTRVLTVKITVR
jgi:hypothetical protein